MSRPSKNPAVPEHLTDIGRKFWIEIQQQYAISDASGLNLLRLAAEALMTAEIARLDIAEHGVQFTDRFGAPRPRPSVTIQKSAMASFARLTRELRLDPVPTGGK